MNNFKEFDCQAMEEYREDFEVKFTNEDYKKFLTNRYQNILTVADEHIKFLGKDPGLSNNLRKVLDSVSRLSLSRW